MAWFRSRDGAVALALLALVVFVVRAFLDWRYVFGDQFSDQSATVVALVVYGLFVGLWSWGLLSAARAERRGIIALLVLTLLLGVVQGVATLVAFCPFPCGTAGGLMEFANWAGLLLGLVAAAALWLQLRPTPGR